MRIQIPEPINPEVLYERVLRFEDVNSGELREMISGVKLALDIAYRNLRKREFSYARYKLLFSTGIFPDLRFLATPLIGAIQLYEEDGRRFALPGFKENYRASLREVMENFEEGMDINLEASVIGFRDTVTREIGRH